MGPLSWLSEKMKISANSVLINDIIISIIITIIIFIISNKIIITKIIIIIIIIGPTADVTGRPLHGA